MNKKKENIWLMKPLEIWQDTFKPYIMIMNIRMNPKLIWYVRKENFNQDTFTKNFKGKL